MKLPTSLATLCAAAITACAFASQWSSDPMVNLPVADTHPTEQVLPKVVSTSDGGVWISWFDHTSGNYDVYIQRLTASGDEVFPHSGLLVSSHPNDTFLVDYDLNVDSTNNAILVFPDTRVGPDRDIQAYLISPAGKFLWGADGVTLSSDTFFEADPRCVQSSDGSYFFLWPRTEGPNPGLIMQKLDSAGVKQFGVDGIKVAGSGAEEPAFCEMVKSIDGSVIAVWQRDTATFSSPRHLHAQRFSSTGAPVWSPNPVVVSSFVVPIAHRLRLVSDLSGGCGIGWHDFRTGSFNCWAQHVEHDGTVAFPANGAQASTNSADRQHLDPAIHIVPGTRNMRIFFREENGGQSNWGVYGQAFGDRGERLWTDSGKELLPVDGNNKSFIRALPYSGGDSLVICLDQPDSPLPGNRVLAMRVDSDGDFVWKDSPRVMSSVLSTKGRLPVTIGPNDDAKAVWEDNREDANDIYAQNIRAGGSLGVAVVCAADLFPVKDGDGTVGPGDLGQLLSQWGSCPPPCAADLFPVGAPDAVVGPGDLGQLLSQWGQCG